MFCISKTRADRKKRVLFLESAGQIYPETHLTFEAPKCVLASVMDRMIKSNRMKLAEYAARMGLKEAFTGFWWEILTERDHLGDQEWMGK
jgi:hypothetical protein